MKQQSRTAALCGVLTALSVVILSLGSLIPAATFCCPVLASYVLVILLRESGRKPAVTAFFAAAILAVLLAPDKEVAGLYLALGYYPVLKTRLDRLPKAAGWAVKLLWFNAAVIAVYAVLLFVLRLDALTREFRETEKWMLIVLLAGGNLVFVLYDFALVRLAKIYEHKRNKLH